MNDGRTAELRSVRQPDEMDVQERLALLESCVMGQSAQIESIMARVHHLETALAASASALHSVLNGQERTVDVVVHSG